MSFQTETASFNVTLAASSNLPNNIKAYVSFCVSDKISKGCSKR